MSRGRFSTGFAAAGLMYNQALTVVSGVLIARIVGAVDYGIANLARSLFQMAAILTPLGLDLALQRYFGSDASRHERQLRVLALLRLFGAGLALFLVALLALGLATWIEAQVYRYPSFALVLVVAFAALPFATDAAVLGGAYRGIREAGHPVFASYVLQPTVRILLVLALFLLGLRLWAIVIGTAAAHLLSWVYLVVRARRTFGAGTAQLSPAWREARQVLGYSWIMGVSLLVTLATRSTDVLVLGHFREAAEVGRYVAVQLLVTLLSLFSSALGQTLGASVAERFAAADIDGVERLLCANIRLIALVTAPLYAALLFWGDRIDLILGRTFNVEWPIVALLATNQLLVATFAFAGFALSMTGRHTIEAWVLAAGLGATLLLCLLLVPRFGGPGAAAATLLAIGGVNVVRFLVVHRIFGISLVKVRMLLPYLWGLGTAAAVHVLSRPFDPRSLLSTASVVIAAVLLYAAGAWLFLLHRGEREGASRVIKRVIPWWG